MHLKQIFHNATNLIKGDRNPSLPQPLFRADEVTSLSSGLSALDKAMGIKGLPQGRITELIGPDSKGTISIALKIVSKFQRKQLPVTIIDMAGSIEKNHAIRCGIIAPELLIVSPENAFELISFMEDRSREKGLVLLNLGFVPHTLGHIGQKTLISLLQRLCRIAYKSESVFLYLTVPENSDPLIHTNYPPGFPLNEVADIRLWVQDEGWSRSQHKITGYRGNITVVKNAFAPQGRGANLRIPFVDPEMMRLSEELGF